MRDAHFEEEKQEVKQEEEQDKKQEEKQVEQEENKHNAPPQFPSWEALLLLGSAPEDDREQEECEGQVHLSFQSVSILSDNIRIHPFL